VTIIQIVMPLRTRKPNASGFTLAEVLIAVAVSVIFATAAFATNKWLLLALRAQKESTAASMMLQERMEAFRGISYTHAASNAAATGSTDPSVMDAADILQTVTTSEAQLGTSLTETLTVSGYMTTTGGTGYPGDGSTPNQWTRSGGSTAPSVAQSNSSIATNYDLIQVDIKLSWTSVNGRTRNRELSSVFGRGNLSQ
jgi:prepilin-type N-terminal cleavage/methylation domain-containing protein